MLDGVVSPEVNSPVNVCYLLDTSGSMYLAHDLVRKHLIDHLIARAQSERLRRAHTLDHGRLLEHARQFEARSTRHPLQSSLPFKYSRFNIIAFTDSSDPWADSVVDLTPENVALASQWVKQVLRVKTGPSHIFQTLLVALQGHDIDEVVLITDAAPADFNFKEDYSRVSIAAKGRPIHTVLIETPSSPTHSFPIHPECEAFARKLTHVTGAVFRKLAVDVTGRFFDEVHLIKEAQYDQTPLPDLPKSARRGVSSDGETTFAFDVIPGYHPSPYLPLGFPAVIPTWRSPHLKTVQMPEVPSLDAASLLLGREVLCRRNKDGFYYLATVSEYVPGSPRFFVTFRTSSNDVPEIEEVFLDNIIKLDDCLRNPIGKGDKVLASVSGKKQGAYSTGIVMDGSDERTGFPCNEYPEVSVAFSTGDVRSLKSDLVIKVPEKFHNKSSHQETVPAVQRRALQLAEEDIQREDKKPEFHSRFPIRPVLAYPTIWYPGLNPYCVPMMASGVPDYPQQEIILTQHNKSFVRASELNREDEVERFPQPFVRGDDEGWCLYQKEPTTCNYLSGDEDEEFDEFLTDVRSWGDRKNVATETDLSLLYPPHDQQLGKRPPWRYWKQKRYEKPPSEQPVYRGVEAIYAPTRSISIKDTSGVCGQVRSHAYFEPEVESEHGGDDLETEAEVNHKTDPMTSHVTGKNVSFVDQTHEDNSKLWEDVEDVPEKNPHRKPDTGSQINDESEANVNKECTKQDVISLKSAAIDRSEAVALTEEDLRKIQVRGQWAQETNRYFDEIRDNLKLQHSRQRRTMSHKR